MNTWLDNISKRTNSNQFNHALLALFILPGLAWVLFDRSLWSSDECYYGIQSYYIFSEWANPKLLWSALMHAQPKPPLLSWLGAFFVPLAKLFNHQESGFLLLSTILQYLSLLLLYKSLNTLLNSKRLALLGSFTLASTLVFITMGIHFYTQMLFLFVVNWFIYIMVHCTRLRSIVIISHLLAATAFASLVKLSIPLFVLVPAVIISIELIKRLGQPMKIKKSDFIYLSLAAIPLALAIAWYLNNFQVTIDYAQHGYGHKWSGIYGDSYTSRLMEWLKNLVIGFGFISCLVIILLTGYYFLKNKKLPSKKPITFANYPLTASAIQVILALLVLATSPNQVFRYTLPLFGYLIIILCYLLYVMNRQRLNISITILIAIQFIFLYSALYVIFFQPVKTKAYHIAQSAVEVIQKTPDKKVMLIIDALKINTLTLEFLAAQKSAEPFESSKTIKTLEFLLMEPSINGEVDKGLDTLYQLKPDLILLTNENIRKQKKEAYLSIGTDGKQKNSIYLAALAIVDSLEQSSAYRRVEIDDLDTSLNVLRLQPGY